MNEYIERASHCGLLRTQYLDCYKADRSPRTGRRLRSSLPTKLERISKQSNWDRLMVKGAAANMSKLAQRLHFTNPEDGLHLTKTIAKLETLLLNKIAEAYEANKATELHERAKWKEEGWK